MESYKENSFASATDEQLVLMVYEGLLSSLKKARIYLYEKKSFNGIGYIEAVHKELDRARSLLYELLLSLNLEKGGEIARNLRAIYLYLLDLITEADITKEIERVDEACNAVVPLLEAFKEAAKGRRGSAPKRRIEVLG